jgi:MFS family permease
LDGSESGRYLALVIALSWLVNLFAFPVAGASVDKFGGKLVLTSAVLLSFFAVLIFWVDRSLLGAHQLVGALALIAMSIADCVVSIAPNSMIPLAAPSEDITRFVGYAASVNSCQAIVGAVIGGSVMALLGPNKALCLLLVMFGIASIAAASLRLRTPVTASKVVELNRSGPEWSRGFLALKTIIPERSFCILSVVINFVLTPLVSIVVPVYIRLILNAPIGYLAAAEISLGCGMLAGTFVAPRLLKFGTTRLRVLITGSVLLAGCISGVTFLAAPWLQAVALGLIGCGVAFNNISCGSLRGHATPDSIRGRLESAVFTCCVASIPAGSWVFGHFVSGSNVHYLGWATGISGLAIISVQLLLLLSRPTVAALTTPDQDLAGYYEKLFPTAFR